MSPNQAFRLHLLRTVYLSGPQPIELNFFHSRFSDIDSKKWLESNGLESFIEKQDISVYHKDKLLYFAIPKFITFIWIACKDEPTPL